MCLTLLGVDNVTVTKSGFVFAHILLPFQSGKQTLIFLITNMLKEERY